MSELASTEMRCRNCEMSLPYSSAKFCPDCGQETKPHVPGFFEYFHEIITHYVALEGKLWKTLWYLFTRPGFLTVEYFAGRRQRYIRPFRLYFSVSLVFFLLVKVAGLGNLGGGIDFNLANKGRPIKVEMRASESWGWLDPLRAAIETRAAAKTERFSKLSPQEVSSEIVATAFSFVPYALFLYLPIYAFILKLVYFDRHRSYGEHMVTTLNTYAMYFLTLLFAAMLPYLWLQLVLVFWLSLHVVWELKRVYGGSWASTYWRSSLLGLISTVPALMLLAVVTALAILN